MKKIILVIILGTIFLMTFPMVKGDLEPKYLEIPSNVGRGDIVFMESESGTGHLPFDRAIRDHVAIYNGSHDIWRYVWNSIPLPKYTNFSFGSGVQEHPLWMLDQAFENFTFYHVNNSNSSIVEGAVAFAISQEDQPYQRQPFMENYEGPKSSFACIYPNPDDPHLQGYKDRSFAALWYCSELVWASYYNWNRKYTGNYGDGICLDPDNPSKIRNGIHPDVLENQETLTLIPYQNPPDTPEKPSGPQLVRTFQEVTYSTKANDIDAEHSGDSEYLYYQWNWSTYQSHWLYGEKVPTDETVERSHIWMIPSCMMGGGQMTFNVRVRAKDMGDHVSYWSEPLNVVVFPWWFGIGTNGPFEASPGEDICYNSYAENGTAPYIYIWDLGDGSNEKYGQNTSHNYTKPGIYEVLLTVEDANGARESCNTTATIFGVQFFAEPNPVIKEYQIEFNTNLIGINYTSTPFYVFNIEGENYSSVNGKYTYEYQNCGTFYEKVTVFDGEGGPVLGIANLTVVVDPFEVDAGGPYVGFVNQPIHFVGGATGIISGMNATWNFGDNSTGHGLDIWHTYNEFIPINESKNYQVSLKIKGIGQGNKTVFTNATIYNESYELPTADAGGPYCGAPNQNVSLNGAGTGQNITYKWTFSDGSCIYNQNVTKKFYASDNSLPALYHATLTVTDENNFSATDVTRVKISKIKANFHWSGSLTDTGPVFFHDDSAPEPCEELSSWYWKFGDNTTSQDRNPSHQYDDDGFYFVSLRVGSNGEYDSVTKKIYIKNVAPVANFNVSHRVTTILDNITFNSTSTDPDGVVRSWKWYFGDWENGEKTCLENTEKNYTFSGFYSVNLTAFDDDGWSDHHLKENYLLIADSIASNDFDENSSGWNFTRFNSIQDAVNFTPWGGVLVILDGQYQINQSIEIDRLMDIYAIREGYNQGDTEIQYGGVEIRGKDEFPIFNITIPYVNIKGITFNDSGIGIRITNDFYWDWANHSLNITDCNFLNCGGAINCSNASNISVYNCVFEDNDYGITIKNSDNVTIQECEITDTNETGVALENSKYVDIKDCEINNADEIGIALDNSTEVTINYCDINQGIIGILVSNVTITNTSGILNNRVVNNIQNCSFSGNTYGVKLVDAMGTRLGGSTRYITHIDDMFPCYYSTCVSGNPMSWFTPSQFPEGCMFYDIDYPIYLDDSDYNVVDGIQVLPAFSSSGGSEGDGPMCAETGIFLNASDYNIIHYSIIKKCNTSGILLNRSDNTTIAFNLIKYNNQGINLTDSCGSLIIANSFYKNIGPGVNISTNDARFNDVMYNDFMFSGIQIAGSASGIDMYNGIQAFDDGISNTWDDDKYSPWREWLSNETELQDNSSQGIGNFWSDYNGTNESGSSLSYNPMLGGPVPFDFNEWPPETGGYGGFLPFPPIGNTSYSIPGSAGSEDRYPILRPVWPIGWYNQLMQNDIGHDPDNIGLGDNVTISANISDLFHEIIEVRVNITDSDGNWSNVTMNHTGNNTYTYLFNDTWKTGSYNYTIWTVTDNNYTNLTCPYNLDVNASVTISVCTMQNVYSENISLNITDPPGGLAPEIGYELLDGNKVLHIWNRYDSYYFNTTSGIQLTNHYGEYWSRNILMLGYYNNDEWNVIYRTDELAGFNKNIDTDNTSFINITLWKDLAYNGYQFRFAIRYTLGVDDTELTVIPYIKNLGNPIPFVLGFAWEINDIMIDMTPEHDYILINDSEHWLNESLDLSFSNLTRPAYCWNETLNETVVCGYESIPYFYIRENLPDDVSKSLYMRWNPDLNYRVWVKSRNNSYNAPVVLGIRIGTLASNQSKQTTLYWYDASEVIYYFDQYSIFYGWENNPGYMVDNQLGNYASTDDEEIEKCTSNSCSQGMDPGRISKVELRTYGYKQGASCSIVLCPVFKTGGGDYHEYVLSSSAAWSDWYDITDDTNAPDWVWSSIVYLDCNVVSYNFHPMFSSTAYCSKVEIRVTYTPWTPPCITNPSPGHGSTNVSISPSVGITVSDDNGETLDISWLSNSSGSWQVFGANNSVGNGTYYQVFDNASVNGQWWYWMVNVSNAGAYNESNIFKFYTGVQSKISNMGSTNLSGYLLMQVEFLNGSEWTLDQVVIDDMSPRTINSSSELGLDTLFNGLICTGDLGFGDGVYRVYAAFRDPDGEVLVVDDALLEAWWSFELDIT